MDIVDHIEIIHNIKKSHSYLNDLSPNEYERVLLQLPMAASLFSMDTKRGKRA